MSLNDIYNPIDCDADYFLDHYAEKEALLDFTRTVSPVLQEILFGVKTQTVLERICKDNKLADQQSALLSRYVRNVVLAKSYIGDMVGDLQTQLGIEQSVARGIGNTLMTELFAPAMNDIKKLQMEQFKDKIMQNQETIVKAAQTVGVSPGNVINLREGK